MKRVKNTETALKSNANNWNSPIFLPTCVSWHYIKRTSPVQVSPTLVSLITLYFFSSKILFVNPWSLCLIFTLLFTILSTNLIKMYRVTRNILTRSTKLHKKRIFLSSGLFSSQRQSTYRYVDTRVLLKFVTGSCTFLSSIRPGCIAQWLLNIFAPWIKREVSKTLLKTFLPSMRI